MENTQNTRSGRTSQERSAAITARTSGASLKRSQGSATKKYQFLDLRAESGLLPEKLWELDTLLHGERSTRNTGECPSAVRESTLWQILQADAPEKYCLSAKACAGILRRAERRGKALPPMLREALEEAIALDV